jgi:hypothetical protein
MFLTDGQHRITDVAEECDKYEIIISTPSGFAQESTIKPQAHKDYNDGDEGNGYGNKLVASEFGKIIWRQRFCRVGHVFRALQIIRFSMKTSREPIVLK